MFRLILKAGVWVSVESYLSGTLQITGSASITIIGRVASSANPEFASGEVIATGLTSGITTLDLPVDQIYLVLNSGVLNYCAINLSREVANSASVAPPTLLPRIVAVEVQNSIRQRANNTYTTEALFNAAAIVNGNVSFVSETGEYFEAIGGIQVYKGRVAIDTQAFLTPINQLVDETAYIAQRYARQLNTLGQLKTAIGWDLKNPVMFGLGYRAISAPIIFENLAGAMISGQGRNTYLYAKGAAFNTDPLRSGVVNLNGVRDSTIGGFTITGEAVYKYGVQVEWYKDALTAFEIANYPTLVSAKAAGFSTKTSSAGNRFENINISNRFQFGIGIGVNSANLDVSESTYHHIAIVGFDVNKPADVLPAQYAGLWQTGVTVGSGVSGNILNHNFYDLKIAFVDVGVHVNAVNETSFDAYNGSYMDYAIRSSGYGGGVLSMSNSRFEEMGGLIKVDSTPNTRHIKINTLVYDPSTQAKIESGVHYPFEMQAAGSLGLSAVLLQQTRVAGLGYPQKVRVTLPTAAMPNGGHLALNFDGLTAPTWPPSALVAAMGTSNVVLNLRGYTYADDTGTIAHKPSPVSIGYNTPSEYQLGDTERVSTYPGESDSLFTAANTGTGGIRRGLRGVLAGIEQFFFGVYGIPNVVSLVSGGFTQVDFIGGNAAGNGGAWFKGDMLIDRDLIVFRDVTASRDLTVTRNLIATAGQVRVPTFTPASSAATGVQGQICHDANYMYWRDATRWNRCARDATW